MTLDIKGSGIHAYLIFCTYGYIQTFVDDSDPVFMYIYIIHTCVNVYMQIYIHV